MVVVASVLQGGAALLFVVAASLPAAIVGAAILGLGYGAYLSVDQALVTQVLPHAEDRGRDLGVIQTANTLPYVFAAGIGGVLTNSLGFPALFLASLVTGLLAAVCVCRSGASPDRSRPVRRRAGGHADPGGSGRRTTPRLDAVPV